MGNILVVDDASLIRMVTSEAGKEAGHSVDVAENGIDGLKKAIEHQYDMIFSDINMPIMNGFEMVEKIKELEKYQSSLEKKLEILERDEKSYKILFKKIPRYYELSEEIYLQLT